LLANFKEKDGSEGEEAFHSSALVLNALEPAFKIQISPPKIRPQNE